MDNQEGRWITINGTHVFVKEGQSPMDAFIKQKGGKKEKEPKGFENSKIRDKNGNLLKMYHGTPIDFKEFDEKYIRQRKDGIKGFYFANEERKNSVAGYYAGEKGVIKEVYLNIEKPLYIKTNDNETLNKMIKSGEINKYDGIVRLANEDMPDRKYFNYKTKTLETEKTKKNDIIEIIAFNKKQIKIIK